MVEGGDFSGALGAAAPAGTAALGRHRMALPCTHSSCAFPAAMGMWMAAGRAEGSAWQWCSQLLALLVAPSPPHSRGVTSWVLCTAGSSL